MRRFLTWATAKGFVFRLSALGLFGPFFSLALSAAPPRIEVDIPQLLVDDALIAHKHGVIRTSHPCNKLSEPVLVPEKPWEAARVYLYGSVLRDPESGGFRMWYMSAGPELAAPARDAALVHSPKDLVLYATSKDGIKWTRPDLGLYSFNGSTANNIVYDLHSPSVVYNPAPSKPEQRYSMLGCGKSKDKRGYFLAHSADGLHWTEDERNPILPGADTCTLARNPWTGEYLAFHKLSREHRGHQRRLVFLSTSRDLATWSEPTLAMAPDELDDVQTKSEGGLCSHFYNMSAFPYGGQFLGFVTHFRYMRQLAEKGPEQSSQDGPIDAQLVHSRDGHTWNRCEDRSPIIANGPHAYDAGCILGVGNGPVIVNDEMWVYYTAINTTHGGAMPRKRVTIARAAWPLDRFVSLDADDDEGIVETASFTSPGTRLVVNADASDGQIAIAVLNDNGDPLPGYDAAQCTPLRSDNLRHEVTWKDHPTLPPNTPIRLRFHLNHAHLFSYTLRD